MNQQKKNLQKKFTAKQNFLLILSMINLSTGTGDGPVLTVVGANSHNGDKLQIAMDTGLTIRELLREVS